MTTDNVIQINAIFHIKWCAFTLLSHLYFGQLFRNAAFTITTMAGEPLLVLQVCEQLQVSARVYLATFATPATLATPATQENFRWMNYEYDLFRVDPRTQQHIPVCRIVRAWRFIQVRLSPAPPPTTIATTTNYQSTQHTT